MVRLQLDFSESPKQEIFKSQFHYGSITTRYGSEALILVPISLNSTMVRLQLNIYFSESSKLESQFHYGSITT